MSDDIYKMIGKTLPGIIDVRDENSSSDEVKAIEQNAIDEKSDSKK